MNKPQQLGFTLWELLVTLLVAGVLLGVGVPNVIGFQRNSAMTAAANDVVTTILMARTEAVKRQVPVTWCLTDNPQAANPTCLQNAATDSVSGGQAVGGYFVWVDENNNPVNGIPTIDPTDGNAVMDPGENVILSRVTAPGGTIRLSASCGYVQFLPTGFTRYLGASCAPQPQNRAILFCDDRGRRLAPGGFSSARVVRIDRPGRGQVLQEQAAVDTVITVVLPVSFVNPTCPP